MLFLLCTARGLWPWKGEATVFLARTFRLLISVSKLIALMSELMSFLWCSFCINMKKRKFLVWVGVMERFESPACASSSLSFCRITSSELQRSVILAIWVHSLDHIKH